MSADAGTVAGAVLGAPIALLIGWDTVCWLGRVLAFLAGL